MKRLTRFGLAGAALLAVLLAAGAAMAQLNTVDLSGIVTDQHGAVVPEAKVTLRNLATNAARTVTSREDGSYVFVGMAPGRYELSVQKTGFARSISPEVVLEIGHAPQVNVQLALPTSTETVIVPPGEVPIIEPQRTSVSETIANREIENLPINGRNYVNFTLINSQANRDSAPSIGAAPTSGLNFGGQRARSNEVSIDGADAVDNSVNGIRSTVSQEDVQEFQLIIADYMPEFGRATGGVINIVTKSGSNNFHGDVFGFLRDAALQARNPFSVAVDPLTGTTTPTKQAYTRAQYGTAFGGPIQKDKTFYFFSFEGTRRHETGFTDIGAGNFDGADPFTGLTPAQAAALAGFPVGVQQAYSVLAASAGSVARTGVDPGIIASLLTMSAVPPGQRFSLPVPCPANTLAPIPCGPTGQGFAPLPSSFVPLDNLIGNYPIVERTDLYSARLDHIWNSTNQSFVRASVSPSFVTGIQVNAQNQNFGQNADSRTSLQQYRDMSFVGQHTTTFSGSLINEARFQFARRGLHYGFSDCPAAQCPTIGGLSDGGQVAVNITGFAFFGREPFSTVDRIERRFQWTDQLTYVKGKHTIKGGVDVNLIQLRSNKQQIFELNFGGIFNFGSISPDSIVSELVGAPVAGLPPLTAIQAYGLGLPQNFIQGTGESNLFFSNKTVGTFIQDSWRISPKVTLNYGIRYDIEFTPTFTPFGGKTGLNAQAEKALNVLEGIPVFDNAFQPRLGIAWDPWGDGKTVIRAGGGIFYDHPLLAVAFDSTTADGARSSQLISGGGAPSACGVFPGSVFGVCQPTGAANTADTPGNLNAGSLFQGVLNTSSPAGFPFSIPYLPNQQRFTALPTTPPSVFVNENYIAGGFATPILPFTLPTAGNFKYGYATQANLSIEHDLGHNFKISVGYQYTKGTHLNRPRNTNVANAALLDENLLNASAAGLSYSNPITVTAPSTNIAPTANFCGATVIQPAVLAVLGNCPAGPFAGLNGQYLSTAAVFNFFRASGPNASFGGPGAVAYPALVGLAMLAGYPRGFSGAAGPFPTPFSDVLQQESTGNSVYNGLTVNLEKRWSQHFQFLASYTWSHAIDDSTDLQTLLAPQDNNNPQLERGNSTFDQRHRFVFSGVAQSPYTWKDGGWKAVLGDWIVAPIVEVSSGRPYTVLTGTDYNLDFGSNTDRPSVVPAGTPGGVVSPYIPGVTFGLANVCPSFPAIDQPAIFAITATGSGCTGNLGRNTFVRPKYATFDLRISRKFTVTERFSVEVLADMFNLLNRFNVGDVSPLCDPGSPTGVNASGTPTCNAGQPTSALDPRTFQFGLKVYW
ncbi:MAG TPA: carboxypeptidase regulatory-like domain-containing protein [Candidatus Acidoferrales bacterium]|nr:carboxypeptidase regulatory-like domain-containing protein [Candidatus Acidoferrales bacterium]